MDTNAGTQVQDDESDDIPIEAGRGGGGDQELIPPGRYTAKLVKFKVEDKPPWKIEQNRKYNPDREPRLQQGAWTFEVQDDGYEGLRLTDWQELSWHEKSNAAKYAAALLGKAKLEGNEHSSTKQLIGRVISIRVIVSSSGDKNYIDPNGCEPVTMRSGKAAPISVGVYVGDEASPANMLARLNTAMEACHMSRGELVTQWGTLGFNGRTREQLSPAQMDKAIGHFEQIAAGLAPVESLPF